MILKWPGGKKWLFKKHRSFFPSSYNTYIEPFFGGGSIFFSLTPKKALLADKNHRLVSLFKMLRDDHENLFYDTVRLLKTHSDKQYYEIRDKFNDPSQESAVQFLYLNRTCFNGVYRENKKGEFNVPIGKRNSSYFPFELNDFLQCSLALKNSTIQCSDFRETVKKAKKGDFIYVDPPYIKYEENYDAFRKYNKQVFSISDLEDLSNELNKIKNKCKILISNFDIALVKELFADWEYKIVEQRTYISGKGKGRKAVKEALIYNYDL